MNSPKILFSSVFKPFAVDDIYSRRVSRIELYHNQLTKAQGVFSLRAFMQTHGLHLIANNLGTPSTVLDFPTLPRFRAELKKGYDYLGIGAILPNFQKVKLMVEEARRISPRTKIILGGFCATLPNIRQIMDVDYVCVGEGISFMRELLGQSAEYTFKNPDIYTTNREVLGVPMFVRHPQIVVGLGCSYGCDFCSPSHFFGRRHIRFYTGGAELFAEMERVADKYESDLISFVGDDNFLLDLKRAEELRQLVVASGKIFKLFIFGSADRATEFGAERLAEMGVSTIWIGRESKVVDYKKNRGVDLKGLIDDLRRHGIKVILSSILLLDGHTKLNIREDIDDHLACRPTFSQFSHYSPGPGTPLYDRLVEEGRILTAIPFEDWHAFKQPWFVHPEFNLTEAEAVQEEAYQRDFNELGPFLLRFIETDLEGWLFLRDSPKSHLRARAKYLADQMWKYKLLLLGMERIARTDDMKRMIREVRARIEASFGPSNGALRAGGLALFAAGRFREFRLRHFGDTMNPGTLLREYQG